MMQLKRKLSKAFNLPLSEFYLKTKNGPLEDFYYDDCIKEYTIKAV